MSGEPTDTQLLTCKAREADASTFPRALANRIDACCGNYIFLFIFQRQATWSLVIISCIMVVACKDNCLVACLVQKKIRMFFHPNFTWDKQLVACHAILVACIGICIVACIGVCLVACAGICVVACIGVCLVACRSSGLTTRTLREARGTISHLQHGRRI